MSINILAFDGDGIGPEIMKSTLNIVEHLNEKLKLKIDISKELIAVSYTHLTLPTKRIV